MYFVNFQCTFFSAGICLPSTHSRHVQFYRKDYTYFEQFDAFYKVHWDVSGSAWSTAFFTCDDEGATLFYPKAQGEWALVKNLTDNMTDAPNVTEIFVGLHDEFNLGEFMTVDGECSKIISHYIYSSNVSYLYIFRERYMLPSSVLFSEDIALYVALPQQRN